MISFGYKDYLRLFLFLKTSVDSDTVMKRIGDMVQMNVRTGFPSDSGYKHDDNEKFLLSKSCTYLQLDASVELKTMFISLPFFKAHTNKSLDSFTVKYKSAVGYS